MKPEIATDTLTVERPLYVGRGNWTEERQTVLANVTMEDIEKQLKGLRQLAKTP
jgi:hypothetical protein